MISTKVKRHADNWKFWEGYKHIHINVHSSPWFSPHVQGISTSDSVRNLSVVEGATQRFDKLDSCSCARGWYFLFWFGRFLIAMNMGDDSLVQDAIPQAF